MPSHVVLTPPRHSSSFLQAQQDSVCHGLESLYLTSGHAFKKRLPD